MSAQNISFLGIPKVGEKQCVEKEEERKIKVSVKNGPMVQWLRWRTPTWVAHANRLDQNNNPNFRPYFLGS